MTGGITFTFGGIRISDNAEVLDGVDRPIPGLFASGELTGGFFFINYPLGCGLTRGAVFGKLAGEAAAALAGRVLSTARLIAIRSCGTKSATPGNFE